MFNNIVQKLSKNQYLKLIGIDQWDLRESTQASVVADAAENDVEIVAEKPLDQRSDQTPDLNLNQETNKQATAQSTISQSTKTQSTKAQPTEIQSTEIKPTKIQPANEVKIALSHKENEVADPNLKVIDLEKVSTLQQLNEIISTCSQCEIYQNRTGAKFGVGDDQADLMIINISSDHNGYEQGGRGVNKTNQLLDNLLRSINLKRNQVFITNIVHCPPEDQNKPKTSEAKRCISFVKKQIELIQPKVILTLGESATQNLLGCDIPLIKLRGQLHDYGSGSIPLIATFNPEYLLRSSADKAKLWDDIKFVRFLLSQSD